MVVGWLSAGVVAASLALMLIRPCGLSEARVAAAAEALGALLLGALPGETVGAVGG